MVLQVKRTGLAVGFQHPTWKEEINFKDVQISSDLLVSPRSASLLPDFLLGYWVLLLPILLMQCCQTDPCPIAQVTQM